MLPAPFRAMDPADDLAWLAVADWLEEDGEPQRAELTRLTRLLRFDLYGPDRRGREDRLMELLAAGVGPCVATLTNSIGMEFVYVPAGTFLMGSPWDEVGHGNDEGPVHEVEITQGFWLGKYTVTHAEYQAVMGMNPSYFSAEGRRRNGVEGMDTTRFPVECVSHEEALSFCQKSSRRAGEKGKKRSYRLPTEAEWEYACRGGPVSKPFHFGTTLSETQARFAGKVRRPERVGHLPPNAFGLHDMHGNVWEWCSDSYIEDYYHEGDKKDPQGPQSGSTRVLRGGSWYDERVYCRAACRRWDGLAIPMSNYGFRVCFAWTR